MTSPRPARTGPGRRWAGLALATVLGGSILSGCAVGRPLGFTGRSDSYCSDALRIIGRLDRPQTSLEQIQYATDRYTALEKTVSELTDSPLPGGTTGDGYRTHWLRPARASLASGRTVLASLQAAVAAGDAPAATRSFEAALTIGTAGVDVGLLSRHGLNQCARLFTATDPR